MKRLQLFLILTALILWNACNTSTDKNQGPEQVSPDIVNIDATAAGEVRSSGKPQFDFQETNFDFGTITSGEEITHEFKFKNSGDADLIISQAKGSCGCTTPEYPQNPVAPGEEGSIKVTFKSQGIAGQVVKDITILANTSPTTKVLTISGEVLKTGSEK
ncbi:MAG: DUF1573 domain-containing protein [Bacteroidia bacterium]|nr:DUF1573 domain-containing protein [Bacteroidia bacterium]